MATTARTTSTTTADADPQPLAPPTSVFDPTHIASLLPRIQHLVALLLTASRNPDSLNEPLTPEQREAVRRAYDERARAAREAEKAAREAKGPNVALGANTEGDDEDAYAFFVGSQVSLLRRESGTAAGGVAAEDGKSGDAAAVSGGSGPSGAAPVAGASLNEALLGRPTALREDIVREAQALKDAFTSARRAVDALQGGDMGLEEQARLIGILTEYGRHQDQVRSTLYEGSASLLSDVSAPS